MDSNGTFDMDIVISQDLPDDLVMDLTMFMVGPNIVVPCIPIEDIQSGSW